MSLLVMSPVLGDISIGIISKVTIGIVVGSSKNGLKMFVSSFVTTNQDFIHPQKEKKFSQ